MLVDFVGNEESIKELEKNLDNKDLSHAYLFLGNEGVGKFTVAKALAKRILCDENESYYCQIADDFYHPDLKILRNDDKSIKKTEIDELVADSFKKPFASKYKVYIIDGFEDVTVSGQNALLKTLEEPEDYVKIILTSKNSKKILPTILSRTRIIKFNNIMEEEVIKFLREKENIGLENATLFAKLSSGSVNRALNYAKNPKYLNLRDEALTIFDRLLNKTTASPFREFAFFNENKEYLKEIFNIYLLFLRDIALVDLEINEDNIMNIDKINMIKKQNITAQKATVISDEIIKTMELLEKNTNFELTIEQLLINIGGMK